MMQMITPSSILAFPEIKTDELENAAPIPEEDSDRGLVEVNPVDREAGLTNLHHPGRNIPAS